MRGLLVKIFLEVRGAVFWFAAGLALIMGLLTALLPRVLGDIHRVFERIPFVKPLLTALLGVDPGDRMTATMSQAFLWVHPTVLTLMWAHEVMFCSRLPAGEVDRGTIDFLLGLPVSRWRLFLAETIGWLCSGAVILLSGYSGHLLASFYLQPDMRPPLLVTVYVMVNLFAVYLAVGGFAFLISSLSDRRGRAVGVVFAVLLISFLLNFVAQFWDPLKSMTGDSQAVMQGPLSILVPAANSGDRLNESEPQAPVTGWSMAHFSVMDYYRPAIIIQSEVFPWRDVGLLIAIAGATWVLAGICLRNRSICTV